MRYWKAHAVSIDCEIFIGRQKAYIYSKGHDLWCAMPVWSSAQMRTNCNSPNDSVRLSPSDSQFLSLPASLQVTIIAKEGAVT